MKKFFAILMTACLMLGVLSIPAFAAEDTVLRVSGEKSDGTVVELKDYTSFEDGWDYAMEYATDYEWMENNGYSRIVVDLFADWNANEDGEFTSDGGDLGFKWDTIRVYEEAIITLNLNGKTIDRGLTDNEYNGEVIYVDDDADFILNNGTITGGNSRNGAGGIHIKDGATVMLNDVNIVGNISDSDDGGGIALYDGAELIMNGGSFRDNIVCGGVLTRYGAAIYVEDAKASFYGVEFKNNQFMKSRGEGAAIYADNSDIYIQDCIFDGNGIEDKEKNLAHTSAVIFANDTSLNIESSTFTNNGSYYHSKTKGGIAPSAVIELKTSTLTLGGNSKFTNNLALYLFFAWQNSTLSVSDSTLTDNKSSVIYADSENNHAIFKNCTFNNNQILTPNNLYTDNNDTRTFDVSSGDPITFYDCDMGNSTFRNEALVKIIDTDAKNGVGSIFSEGSLTLIIAILALIASLTSICLTVIYNKKKAVSASANNAPKTETENKE